MPNSGPYFKCRIHLGSTRDVRARRTDDSRLNAFTGRHPTDRADRSCSRSVSKIESGTRMAEACACRFRKRGVPKSRKSPGCFVRISTGRTGYGHLVPSPDGFPSILSESRLKPNPIQDLSGNFRKPNPTAGARHSRSGSFLRMTATMPRPSVRIPKHESFRTERLNPLPGCRQPEDARRRQSTGPPWPADRRPSF